MPSQGDENVRASVALGFAGPSDQMFKVFAGRGASSCQQTGSGRPEAADGRDETRRTLSPLSAAMNCIGKGGGVGIRRGDRNAFRTFCDCIS